ncbi:MAG: DUF2202 domain-containing protein [Vicingaceae bacterium]
MKTLLYIFPALFLLTATQSSCSKDEAEMLPTNQPANDPITQLTDDEKNSLVFMREEEKLARDVYLYSLDLYGMKLFSNISQSEQVHMDAIHDLMVKYKLEDMTSKKRGVFNNTELQKLYTDLTAKCDLSLLDAMVVGATIEDLDIKDLKEQSALTSKADILIVFEFLTCGSRNHMRSFDMQVGKNGGEYKAQFISQLEYDGIVNSSKEQCAL